MVSASPEAINVYAPMPDLDEPASRLASAVEGSERIVFTPRKYSADHSTPELGLDGIGAGQQLLKEPTVEINGELDLGGGWTLQRYVNPRECDTITIYLEREKTSRSAKGDEIDEEDESESEDEEEVPVTTKIGYVYVPVDDVNAAKEKKAPTARDLRAEGRKKPKPDRTEKSDREGPGRTTASGINRSPQGPGRRLSIISEASEGEGVAGANEQDIDAVAKARAPPRRDQGTRRPTHPDSIPQNVAGLGAPRRPSQFMQGLGEDIRRQSAAARMAREAADDSHAAGAAGRGTGSSKRKGPDHAASQKRSRPSHASEVLSDHFEEGAEGASEAETPTQPPAKEKKKRGRPRKEQEDCKQS